MMAFNDEPVDDLPIQVGPSAVPDTLKALFRQLVIAICSFAVGRGWVDADNVDGILTIATLLLSLGWALHATFRRKSQLVTAASAAPNDIAQVNL